MWFGASSTQRYLTCIFLETHMAFIFSVRLVLDGMDKKVSTQERHILGCKGQWFWFMDLAQVVEAANFLANEFLRFEIQNGKSASFWFDDWLGMGKLLDIIADLGTRYLGVLCSATFADHAGDESSWKIRARVQR